MKTTLFLFTLIFCFTNSINAQCIFNSAIAENHLCDGDGNFLVDVEFEAVTNGNQGYTITANGILYGPFEYDEPFVTVGPLLGDGLSYELTITDVEFGCSYTLITEAALCDVDCQISNFTLTPETCGPDSLFYILVDFEVENPASDSFRLMDITPNVNNAPWGILMNGLFGYEDLPLTAGPFLKDHLFLPTRTWKVWDLGDTLCYDLAEVDFGCNCNIQDIETEIIDCDNEGNFYIVADFLPLNTPSDSFEVVGNGIYYGLFQHDDLPIELGPFEGDGTTQYELIFRNAGDNDCSNFVEIGPIDCDNSGGNCNIFDVIAEVHPCEDDGTFFVDIDFEVENVGNEGFRIQGNGNNYGTYDYNEPFITLGPFDSNDPSVLEFVVIDNQLDNCSDFVVIDAPQCDLPCEITNFVIEVGECKTQNSYELTIIIEAQNPPNQMVELNYGGLPLGLYNLNEFPITIPNFYDFGESSPLIFANILGSGCFDFGTFIAPDCDDHPNDCFIGSPFSIVGDCDGDSFDVTMFLDIENAGNDFFEVFYAGENLGTYPISQMPFTLMDFVPNNEPFPTITICVNDNPDCCRQLVLENPCYQAPCEISNLTVETGNCNPDGSYLVIVDFDYENSSSHSFELFNDNISMGIFSLDLLPLYFANFPNSGGTVNNIGVCLDDSNSDCCASIDFDEPDCGTNNCSITDLVIEVGDCNPDNTYHLWIDFEYSNSTTDEFQVILGNQFLGNFLLNDLPIHIEDVPNNGATSIALTVCIADGIVDCCDFIEFDQPECSVGDCSIEDLNIEFGDCNPDGTFEMWVVVEASSPTHDFFDFFFNNQFVGFYSLNDQPIYIPNFDGGGNQTGTFTACINDNPNCCGSDDYQLPNCDSDNCDITDLIVEIGDCTSDSTYNLWIDFEYTNVTIDHFFLSTNGVFLGDFLFSNLPIHFEEFPMTPNGIGDIEVCISDGTVDCCESIDWVEPDCHEGCEIYDLWTEVEHCDSDTTFLLHLGFEHENTGGEGFSLIVNGEDYGDFEYVNVPLLLGPLPSGNIVYEFEIIDNEVDNCSNTLEFGPWFCDDECHINNVLVTATDCNNDEEFYVELDLNYQNVGDEGFLIHGNGQFYGHFNYSDLPITLGPFLGNTGMVYEFGVTDSLFQDCTNWAEVGPIECDGDCSIHDFEYDLSDCNDEGEFYAIINFEYENPDDDDFIVNVNNGDYFGIFAYADLPVEIGPFEGDGTTHYQITIGDGANPDCVFESSFGPVDCSGSDCEILNFATNPWPCNNGFYNLWVNFEIPNSVNDSIHIFDGDGNFLGDYLLDEMPIFITGFPASGNEEDVMTICVNIGTNDECCETFDFTAPDCNLAWPGDANNDNIANNFDLLNIGLAFGTEGLERETQGIEWIGLDSEDWGQSSDNNVNFKHADCNGNGEITNSDIEAILINYNETHGEVQVSSPIEPTDDDPVFFVDLPNATDIKEGEPFTAPIILGSETEPLDNIYGIAFTLNFDPDIINPSSIEISYDPSWIGVQPINLIKLDKTFANEGKVEIALTRTDQNNVSGFGEIAGFIGIIDNIAGKQEMSIEITDVKAIKSNEIVIPLRTPTEVIELVTSTKNPNKEIGLNIFPNPTTNMIYIKNEMNYEIENVEIQDVNGRVIERINVSNNAISMENLPAGMYIINVQLDGQNFFERIIKLEK